MNHDRTDESHKGKIGICVYCVMQDKEDLTKCSGCNRETEYNLLTTDLICPGCVKSIQTGNGFLRPICITEGAR